MKKNNTSSKGILSNNFWMLGRIFKYTPAFAIVMVLEGILLGINDSIGMIYTKLLLDAIGTRAEFLPTLNIAIGLAIYLLCFHLFRNWCWQVFNPVQRERLLINLNTVLFTHAVSLDLDRYDDPEFYNDFIWSMNESYERSIALVEDTGKLINRIVSLITITSIILSIDKYAALIIILVSCARVLFSTIQKRIYWKYRKDINPLLRKNEYFKRIFTLPDYAKDLRISDIKDNLYEDYDKTVEGCNDLLKKYAAKRVILLFVSKSIALIGETLIYLLIIYKIIVTKTLSLGSFAVALNAVSKTSRHLYELVECFLRYHEHGLFITKIREFLECQPKIKSGKLEAGPFEKLTIKNLSFTYKDREKTRYALKNVNLEIEKGQKIAIVGYNGAGKTTFTKLLMRLYDPMEGGVLYNGKPLKEYTIKSLREKTAAVFQDYRIFAATLAENVVGEEFDDKNKDRVVDSLVKSVFKNRLETLPNGINTILTREFDEKGVQLSGGEQQKVAIARAFYKNADLIILDEPSSALDPDAEYELNKAIANYAKDKTVIFISHRLSTTKHADKIFMFDSGEIIESGTHDELIAKNGKYAYMFNLQAENYRK